jgi:GT2 family glycosyltransferase
METLVSDNSVGFVGPTTNNCHGDQSKLYSVHRDSQKYKDKIKVLKNPICGFCFIFKKELFLKLKGFDPRYPFYGAESDFCDRAMKLGYKCVWRQDAFVYHIGSASIKAANKSEEEERRKALKLYWSTRKKPK